MRELARLLVDHGATPAELVFWAVHVARHMEEQLGDSTVTSGMR